MFKAKHKIDGSFYALKMISLTVPQSYSLMDHKVIKEARTMMKLNHKNVVRYITCWFQLMVDGLKDLIQKSKSYLNQISEYDESEKKSEVSRGFNWDETKNSRADSESEGFNWNEQSKDKIQKKSHTVSLKKRKK